jgi:acyl-coenzyme A synthetase/AMP-(fatty) acid ligase
MTQLVPDLSGSAREPSANLFQFLAERATTSGWLDRPAFTTGQTHGEVYAAAARAAGVLYEWGVHPGTRVLIVLHDSAALIAALLGTFHLGALAVLASPHATEEEHAHILADSAPWLVVCEPDLACRFGAVLVPADLDRVPATVPEPAGVDPEAPAYVQYTSGTTGPSKGVVHGPFDPLTFCRAFGTALEIEPEDVLFSASKACYPWGLGIAFFALYFGASAVLWPDQAGAGGIALQARAHRPTLLFTYPAHYARMIDITDPGDFSSLRAACTAGESLMPALADRIEAFLGCPLLNGFGTTEAGHTFITNTPRLRRRGSLGVPLDPFEVSIRVGGREARAGERGALHVRGPCVLREYLNLPAATGEVLGADGWLRTGDLVHRDHDGFVYHHGRIEDLHVIGGVTVVPAELERLIGTHPAVAEVAVVGEGEALRAFVVPTERSVPDAQLENALLKLARTGPATVVSVTLMEGLPRTTNGKIRRRLLSGPAT